LSYTSSEGSHLNDILEAVVTLLRSNDGKNFELQHQCHVALACLVYGYPAAMEHLTSLEEKNLAIPGISTAVAQLLKK